MEKSMEHKYNFFVLHTLVQHFVLVFSFYVLLQFPQCRFLHFEVFWYNALRNACIFLYFGWYNAYNLWCFAFISAIMLPLCMGSFRIITILLKTPNYDVEPLLDVLEAQDIVKVSPFCACKPPFAYWNHMKTPFSSTSPLHRSSSSLSSFST